MLRENAELLYCAFGVGLGLGATVARRQHVSDALGAVGQWMNRVAGANVDCGVDHAWNEQRLVEARSRWSLAPAGRPRNADRAAVLRLLGSCTFPQAVVECAADDAPVQRYPRGEQRHVRIEPAAEAVRSLDQERAFRTESHLGVGRTTSIPSARAPRRAASITASCSCAREQRADTPPRR